MKIVVQKEFLVIINLIFAKIYFLMQFKSFLIYTQATFFSFNLQIFAILKEK